MELQKKVLEQYYKLTNKPTFKEISEDTGIQITRVFRLFNGAPMKLGEYEIFNKKVKDLTGMTSNLEEMAFECSIKLGSDAVKELEVYLMRKLQIWKLKKTNTVYEQMKMNA